MRLPIADFRLQIGMAVAIAGAAAAGVVVSHAQEPTRVAPTRAPTMRPEILGTHGIVAAGRHYSVAAGVRILQQGGNAIDAGVASVFAASVVEISHFGFGGEVPTMIYDAKTKEVIVISGQGPAPRAATPALFKATGLIPGNGPLGATIPAVMDAMALALETKGTLRLEQVMAPAIELADGFPMYEFLRNFFVSERRATEQYEWSARTYYPNGQIPDVGEIFRQPNLARTLRAIVAAEATRLREGARPRRRDPRRTRRVLHGGHRAPDRRGRPGGRRRVHLRRPRVVPRPHREAGHDELPRLRRLQGRPMDQGPVLLQTLNILDGVDLKAMGANSADYIHTVHEAIKLAYDDRNAYYGDPLFAKVPMRGLLSKAYAAERRALIGPRASLEHRVGDPFPFDPDVKPPAVRFTPHAQGFGTPGYTPGDTTCVDVVDKDGNLFSATPSSGWLLGGAFLAGDTGVPLSNRMQVFDLDPASPNVLEGGKRPRTTLTPTIVLKDGRPFLAISTPGGDSQDQQVLNVLLRCSSSATTSRTRSRRRASTRCTRSVRSTTTRASRACSRSRTACRPTSSRPDGARPHPARARPVRDEHGRRRRRGQPADGHAARGRRSEARAVHLWVVGAHPRSSPGCRSRCSSR